MFNDLLVYLDRVKQISDRISQVNYRKFKEIIMLHLLNFCLLQWVGLRLTKIVDIDSGQIIGWKFIKVLPLSGYFDRPFIYW